MTHRAVGAVMTAEVATDGRLTGIVTPRDLLKVYLRSDDEIRGLGD